MSFLNFRQQVGNAEETGVASSVMTITPCVINAKGGSLSAAPARGKRAVVSGRKVHAIDAMLHHLGSVLRCLGIAIVTCLIARASRAGR